MAKSLPFPDEITLAFVANFKCFLYVFYVSDTFALGQV